MKKLRFHSCCKNNIKVRRKSANVKWNIYLYISIQTQLKDLVLEVRTASIEDEMFPGWETLEERLWP